MADMPNFSTSRTEKANPAPSRISTGLKRGVAAIAIAAAGLTAFNFAPASTPAFAQLRPDPNNAMVPVPNAPGSFADLVEQVKPAVVSISVENGGEKKTASNDKSEAPDFNFPNLPDDHPLNDFFKNLPKGQQAPKARPNRPSMGQGSGFVISQDGYVVTNNHVIDGSSKIEVSFDGNEKYDAELVGTDARTDLALLKIKKDGPFPFVEFADQTPRVGDWVVAVGNPFGLGGTVTAGILSAAGRDIGSGPYDFLQIDAAVNRGNSGGPTFDLKGRVIGVNTAIYSPSGGNVGIAFAVPAKTATAVINQLKTDGTVSRGWLGVKIQNIDEDTAASLGLAKASGALVTDVTGGGPAEKSGMELQDAILSVNGQTIEDSRDLARKIAEFSPDTTVDVGVWRGSAKESVKVTLGRFPSSTAELAALQGGKAPVPEKKKTEMMKLERLGVTLLPVRAKGQKTGVVIAEVADDSDAARKGLKAGDIILEVQGQEVGAPADVEAGVEKAQSLNRGAVLLQLQSGDQKRFVAVQLEKKD